MSLLDVLEAPELIKLPATRRPVRQIKFLGERGERAFVVVTEPVDAVALVALGVECTASGKFGGIGLRHTGTSWRLEFHRDEVAVTSVPFENGGELCDLLARWWPRMNEEGE